MNYVWCLVRFGRLCFINQFSNNYILWPQQPPKEENQISVKHWIFDDPFHKKELVLVIWVLLMIKLSGSVNF